LRGNLLLVYSSLLALSTNGNCAFICLFIYRLLDIVFKELTSGQHVCLLFWELPAGAARFVLGAVLIA
jgi:hypothetical protein